jgi:putative ABC transport system substrate-binding protein
LIREYPQAGGLMSHGTNLNDAYLQWAAYVGRLLKAGKPTDFPVVQFTKFEFVINLETTKALGVDVPPNLLVLADEVSE